jgi:hypothetical protein
MKSRSTFLFTRALSSTAFLLALGACLAGCPEDGTERRYSQEYSVLINNHGSSELILMEVLVGEIHGGPISYHTEFHNLNIPPGALGVEIVIAQRWWTNPSSPDFYGTNPLSIDLEDAAGHRETFPFEWWNAEIWEVGDTTYYRRTIDF